MNCTNAGDLRISRGRRQGAKAFRPGSEHRPKENAPAEKPQDNIRNIPYALVSIEWAMSPALQPVELGIRKFSESSSGRIVAMKDGNALSEERLGP
jgi:hypothetical protein